MAVNLKLSRIMAFLNSKTQNAIKGNETVAVYIYQYRLQRLLLDFGCFEAVKFEALFLPKEL